MGLVHRRDVVRGAAAAAALALLPGARAHAAAAAIRWVWWGNPERDRRTNAAIQAFQARHAEIKVSGEAAAWPDYWPKVATQVAGRRAADVLQMDYRYLIEYARRGALRPLDDLIPDPLDLTGFDKSETAGGTVDGKIYGVSVGANAFSVHWNKAAFQRAGVPEPKPHWTWDDLVAAAAAIAKAGPKGFYGVADGGRYDEVLERWLQQRGKGFFTPEGQLAFTADDAAEFFAYWDDLRKRGIATPADVTATDRGELNSSMLTTGKAAMAWHHANQLPGVQGLMTDPVGLATYPAPAPGKPDGNYLKPSQLMSVYAKSPQPKAAASLIRFVIADPEGAGILGIERGVPESKALRERLSADLLPLDRQVVEYVGIAAASAVRLPPPAPKGGGQVNLLVPRIGDKIAFGQVSVKDGAKELVDTLTTMLKQA